MLLEISWFREQECRGQECFKICSGSVKTYEALFDHGNDRCTICQALPNFHLPTLFSSSGYAACQPVVEAEACADAS